MTRDDALIALNIVEGKKGILDPNKTFHNYSFMYRTTNERVNEYANYLARKKRILSVISSGDHIFNSIFNDSFNIDAFDISCYPKRYVELRRAAFNSLSYEEYMRFFYGDITPSEDFDDMYFSFNKYLDSDDKEFWDFLFNYLDWYDMVNSPFFSHEQTIISNIVEKNPYLQKENYLIMKDKLSKANINYMKGNILDIVPKLKNKYSTILLSNIIQYVEFYSYVAMLYELPLYENGQAITYLYKDQPVVRDILKDDLIVDLSGTAKILVHSGKQNKN